MIELLIQEYGVLAISLIILFQIFNIQSRILKIEMKLDNFNQRLTKLEQEQPQKRSRKK